MKKCSLYGVMTPGIHGLSGKISVAARAVREFLKIFGPGSGWSDFKM